MTSQLDSTSLPTPEDLADWCHPRRPLSSWSRDSSAADEPNAPPPAANQPRRILGIWAHPDDEAYLSAGLMARTVQAGGDVTVVALTDGELGFPDTDGRCRGDRAAQRRRELRSAMATIGVHDVRFLGLPDGALERSATASVIAAVAELIADAAPDVVVTFGPDGVTGHPDHIANSAIVTCAWQRAGRGQLWYAAKTVDWLAEWHELHDEFGVWMTEEPNGVEGTSIEMVIDLDGSELEAKRAVLAEHSSQTAALAAAFGESTYRRWIRQETFRRPTAHDLRAAAPVARGAVA